MKKLVTNLTSFFKKFDFGKTKFGNLELNFDFEIRDIEYVSDLKKFDIIIHKNGNLYEILDLDTKVQIDDKWVDAVIYKEFFSQQKVCKYVRDFESFKKSFKKIEIKEKD